MIHIPDDVVRLVDLHELEEKLEGVVKSRPALRSLLDSMPEEYKRGHEPLSSITPTPDPGRDKPRS